MAKSTEQPKKEKIVNLNEDLSSKKSHDANSFEQALKNQEAIKKEMKGK